MLNAKEHFNQLDATLTFEELDNETAATIQGGYDLQVYRHANQRDLLGEFNFGKDSLSSNANDQISSIKVNAGRWRLYQFSNYSGKYVEYTKPGKYNIPSSLNDNISSIQRF